MIIVTNMQSQEPQEPQESQESQDGYGAGTGPASPASPVLMAGHWWWPKVLTPSAGKMVRRLSRLAGHGGSAFPGKVVEGLDPGFLARTLGQLPYGVVLVSGTNGKTTTTRIIAMMLEQLGLKVFTNPTGSNFTRGVVSALLDAVDRKGRLDCDIAVLELDEAYAVHFVGQIKPRYALLLNVMRDQLDRFGEIDNTARLLGQVAAATTGTVVLNREDLRIASLADNVPRGTQVKYFGLVNSLRSYFPSDDDMHAADMHAADLSTSSMHTDPTSLPGSLSGSLPGSPFQVGAAADMHVESPRLDVGREAFASTAQPADVTLKRVGEHDVEFLIDGDVVGGQVRLEGMYNLFNAAAALVVVRAVLADTSRSVEGRRLMEVLGEVTPAFGRGEVIEVQGAPVELLLVKNPMGFRLSLGSFAARDHGPVDTMIAICDEYADGRDMSWLWDVDFTTLRSVAMVSGTRAWDMTLRLEYDGVPVQQTDTQLEEAVERFVTSNPGVPKHIYCTYTAMLRTRAALARLTEVSDAGVGR